MGAGVACQLLGPVRIQVGGRPVALYGSRQERLVAALLLDAGRPVSMDRLIEIVWDADAPATARRQVQDLAGRLRRDLAAAGTPPTIVTMQRAGYALQVAPECVDVAEFRRYLAQARACRPVTPVAAVTAFRTAFGLWHGEPMAGLYGRLLETERIGLHETRLSALEQCIETELGIGGDTTPVSELSLLIEQYPYRERFVALYMHALYRAGRTADALAAFHALRRRLAEELGLQPGCDVARMHQLVLTDDPCLLPPALRPWPASSRTSRPARSWSTRYPTKTRPRWSPA